jgi:hypothetical protein
MTQFLPITEVQIREPNLLIPRQSPTGKVILNKYHPLYKNVIWMFIATRPEELATRGVWRCVTGALANTAKRLVGTPNGLAIDTGNLMSGGLSVYYLTGFTKPRMGVTSNLMFCMGNGDTTVNTQTGSLVNYCVNYGNQGFILRGEQTNNTGKVGLTTSTGVPYNYTSSLSSPTSGSWVIGSILKSSTCQMMVNGTIEAETAFTWSVTSNDLSRIFIGCEAAGMNGVSFNINNLKINMAVMLAGEYPADWLLELYKDPYQLVMPA